MILDEDDHEDGVANVAGDLVPRGTQQLFCKGLEFLLARSFVNKSFAIMSDGSFDEIPRVLGFNLGQGGRGATDEVQLGNRDSILLAFAQVLDADALEWSARDIVRYLLEWFSPLDIFGDYPLEFELSPTAASYLEAFRPRLDPTNRSVFDLLNELIDRRRGVTWCVRVADDSTNKAQIHVCPFLAEDLTFENGEEATTLPANPNVRSLDYRNHPRLSRPVRTQSQTSKFDQIKVRGARRTATFSISSPDDTLLPDWTDAQQELYDEAATGEPGYSALEYSKKIAANRQARSADRVERVYSWFRLPDEWDGRVGDGIGGEKHAAFPDLSDPETLPEDADPVPLWFPGLVFTDYLTLKTDHRYTGTLVLHEVAENETPEGSANELVRPMAFIKVPSHTSGVEGAYARLEKLSESSPLARLAGGAATWNGSLRMQQHAPGVIIRVSGEPQHIIASTDFGGTDPTDDDFNGEWLDWRDNLILTVCLEGDDFCEATYPTLEDSELYETIADSARVLTIDVGNSCRLDYLVPGTVFDISAGQLVRTVSGGWLRDDRPVVLKVARMAYEWYRRPRVALDLHYADVNGQFTAGHLIAELGDPEDPEQVSSLITEVRYDLTRGTTNVRTAFAELDAGSFFNRNRGKGLA